MAGIPAGSPDWRDLNLGTEWAPNTDIPTAIHELLANALDANDAAGVTEPPSFSVQRSSIVLSDKGHGISLHNFAFGRNATSTSLLPLSSRGQFGEGLKIAITVLMRHGATIQITSQYGRFEFEKRLGGFGTTTIHVRCTPLALGVIMTGTTVVITGVQKPGNIVALVKEGFRLLSDAVGDLITSIDSPEFGTISVYNRSSQPTKGKHYDYLFVNGVKKTCTFPLFLHYDIAPPPTVASVSGDKPTERTPALFCRDHNFLIGQKDLFAELMKRLTAEARAALLAHAPTKSSCEFNTQAMRDFFYPVTAVAVAPHARAPVATAAGPAPALVVAASPLPSPAAIKVEVLYDYENAHNALGPLIGHVATRPHWRLKVFVPLGGGSIKLPADLPPNVEVVEAPVESPEAADTTLCFHAGTRASAQPMRFVVVCGAEKRYAGLPPLLCARAHGADIIRFDNERQALEAPLGD